MSKTVWIVFGWMLPSPPESGRTLTLIEGVFDDEELARGCAEAAAARNGVGCVITPVPLNEQIPDRLEAPGQYTWPAA